MVVLVGYYRRFQINLFCLHVIAIVCLGGVVDRVFLL